MSKGGDYLLARGWRIYQRKRKPLNMGWMVLWTHDKQATHPLTQAEALKMERALEREYWKEKQHATVQSVLERGSSAGVDSD